MKRIVFSVPLLFLLFTASAAAQQNASLRGFVTKFYGEIVPQARVVIKLKSGKKKFTRKTKTNYAGEYFFGEIPPGVYEISASDDALTYINHSFEVLPDPTTRLDLELEYGGNCRQQNGQNLKISDLQKARVANAILKDIFSRNDLTEMKTLTAQKEGIALLTDNLQIEGIKPPQKIKFQLMSRAEARKRATESNPFLYLSFGDFQIKGNCLVVTITNSWATDFNSKNSPTSGGGIVYVYRIKGKKLVLKTSKSWSFKTN